MAYANTFRLPRPARFLPIVAAIALAAATAVAGVALWALTRSDAAELDGVILYTTAAGDFNVRPDGEAVAVSGPPVVSFVAPGGVEEFPTLDGSAVAYVERTGAEAWLSVRDGGDAPHQLALLADESTPPLVNGVKANAQIVGGVPLVVSWSPDGRYLAYGSLTGMPFTLHLVERETLQQRDYEVAGGYIGELVWSADSEHLAISTYSPDRVDHIAYVLDPGGGAPERLIDGCHIIWAPDGEHIVLHRDPQREPGAWIVAIDGSESYALSNDPTAFPLSWQPEKGR
jgi:hypothetical protein